MANVKYLVIAGLIAAGVASTPLVISKMIDSKIEENRVVLEKNGFKQEMLGKSGYFETKRVFSLEIVDAKKARDFLLDTLVEKNAQYKIFAQSLKSGEKEEINDAFNGLTFKGEMINSNLFLSDTKMSLALSKFPTSLEAELIENKEVGNALLPLLTKGVFAVDMVFGRDEKLKDLKLRNIKEQMKIEDVTLEIDASNHILSLSENGGLVSGVLGAGGQDVSIKAEMFTLKSHLENFKYHFDYKDDLNNKGELALGKYAFETSDPYSSTSFLLGNVNAKTSIDEVRKDLQIKADYTLNDISFKSETEDVTLKKLWVKLFLRGINADTMKKLQNDYNAMVLGIQAPSDEAMIADFVAIINQGVKLDLEIALKDLGGALLLKDIAIDIKFEIPQNKYNDKESPLAILNLFNVTSKVKMHKEDKKTLESLSFAMPEDFAGGKVEGDFVIYDIVMQNSAISINGKSLQ